MCVTGVLYCRQAVDSTYRGVIVHDALIIVGNTPLCAHVTRNLFEVVAHVTGNVSCDDGDVFVPVFARLFVVEANGVTQFMYYRAFLKKSHDILDQTQWADPNHSIITAKYTQNLRSGLTPQALETRRISGPKARIEGCTRFDIFGICSNVHLKIS